MWESIKSKIILVIFIFSIQTTQTNGANILGLFVSHSPSHLIVHMSIVKALAERGHNVTVVSAYSTTITHPNIHQIVIPPLEVHQEKLKMQMAQMTTRANKISDMLWGLFDSLSVLIDMQFDIAKDQRFRKLYEQPDTKFDLVILGYCFNDFLIGVAAKFNCPIAMSWFIPTINSVNDYIGNTRALSYVPNIHIHVPPGRPMSFSQRIRNLISTLVMEYIDKRLDYRMIEYYQELFPHDDLAIYRAAQKNVSLLFVNHHFSEGPIRPNVPAVVEIGGIQIKEKSDPLPEDILTFLEQSKQNGAVLFSLGTNLQISNMDSKIVRGIFETLSSLKQNVIWKWDNLDNTPGISSNILYKTWLPQDDILAHPNLKLFITHAGRGSYTEAQYHGVPMVLLPVFSDQHINANNVVAAGNGIRVDLLQFNATNFKAAVLEVLQNSTYKQKVTAFSKLYRDRPLSAKESVVYWTEYVIRHHGAAHLQSPLVHMSAIESSNLDVIIFLLIICYVLWLLVKLIFKLFVHKVFKFKKQERNNIKVKSQ